MRVLCCLTAVAVVCAVVAATVGHATADPGDAVPYRLREDCPAKHLTEENFEHVTQASGGMTSGNWLIFFVPSNDGATVDQHSDQTVHSIASFDAFVRLSPEVLSTYHVLPAFVVCDESPGVCARFSTADSPARLLILSARRMYPFPADHIRTVDDIELFVSAFRRMHSSAVPPPQPGMKMGGQLLLLLAGVIGIVVVRSVALQRMNGPLPPPASATHEKAA
ncbi:hypothetical protein NESM_000469500 [Novymonas esmeraldas]|uniref:Uncharacterized protein n=1 Tax=Novymonas esmeraldas TaxID=1808958 RepID=A0AAW0ERJ5_9TRYP